MMKTHATPLTEIGATPRESIDVKCPLSNNPQNLPKHKYASPIDFSQLMKPPPTKPPRDKSNNTNINSNISNNSSSVNNSTSNNSSKRPP